MASDWHASLVLKVPQMEGLVAFQAKSTYDVNLGKRVVTQQANGQWLEQVKARFPKDAKIILVCSDGDKRSQQAQSIPLLVCPHLIPPPKSHRFSFGH